MVERTLVALLLVTTNILLWGCGTTSNSGSGEYDLIIRQALVYDGSGRAPVRTDLAISGDRIAVVGPLRDARGKREIDANGMAAAPGFINMLSQSDAAFLVDGRSQGEIREGVTLEIFGEGESMGPLTPEMKGELQQRQGDLKYDVTWNTLGEYLDTLEKNGVSPNVASYVGAATVRANVLGYENRDPTPEEMLRMKEIVRQAMREGAFGVASALIYAPGVYAKTPELIELSKAAGEFGGMYISHLRSEGDRLVEAVDELITIAREAGVPAEIYHLKAAGERNWPKIDEVIRHVEEARARGLAITADMYTYTAGATGLDAAMPPWVQEGGFEAWRKRLQDPGIRQRVKQEMTAPDGWESLYVLTGSPERVLFTGFKSEALKPLTGRTLAEVAKMRGKSPEDTIIDLVIEDDSRVETVYFLMSEDNVRKEIRQPWVSFDSDAASIAPEGVFLKSGAHPRAYGNFARLLGRYVRDENVISLQEAVRRLTSLPASNLKLDDRGLLAPGYFADIVLFDAGRIADHATFENPHQYSTGVRDVFVNGVQVLRDGEHTGATPGRVLHGPGWKQK